ncbi:MAG TPA: permease prefix domain 1-containing protein, partial [Candidatus Krumholzibacteria bacterium]
MTRLRTFVARVRGWLLGRRLDRELHEEISGHLEEATEELQRQGLSAGEARRVARLRFGGVTQTRETWRAARSFGWVDRLSRTTGYAIRLGLRHKIGTLTTIV